MIQSLTPAVQNILTSSIHGPSHMVLSIRFLSSDWLKIICSRASRLGAATTTTTQRRCRRPTRILELRGRMRGGEGMGPGWSNFSTFCSSNMSWVFMPEISVNFHNDDYVTRYFVTYLPLYSCNWKTKHFTAGVDLDPPYFLSWIWRNKFSKNRTLVLHTLHTIFYRIRWWAVTSPCQGFASFRPVIFFNCWTRSCIEVYWHIFPRNI